MGNALHCAFSGKLDGFTCSEIEQELLSHTTLFRENCKDAQLVFDLTEVVFISSSFLRLCLIHHRTFGKSSFTVRNVSKEIRDVFHISGFAAIMNIIPADEAA